MTIDLKKHLQDALGHTYFFDRELGAAGMSRVFLAHDMALRRKVVVKVLPPELAAAKASALSETDRTTLAT